jgi:hypothetical protein
VRTTLRRPAGRGLRAAVVAALAAGGLVVLPATLAGAQASFSATTGNTGDALATDQLQPPSALSVTQTCTTTPAITHRAVATGGGTASLSLTPPGTTTPGDVLVVHLAYRDAPETVTAPGGWTRLTQDTSSNVVTSEVWWKLAQTGEGTAVFSRPAGAPGPVGGGMFVYVGASTTAPVVTSGHNTGATATMPAVSTPATTVEVLHLLTKDQEVLPAPAGTTLLGSGPVGSSPAVEGLTAADETVAGPGVLPARSAASGSGTSSAWIWQTVVLRRAPGTPSAALSWTASPSTWGSGYLLSRDVGGTTQSTQTLGGIPTTTATDGPLVNGTAYTYRLRAYLGSWRSTTQTGTLTPACP